ncbi:MAG TPA: antibiotic biosynthesis monooxygenase [Acidimicrobiales bacterium]|nr:antibiotic biosynthesis monooxygenase [Acidimicrobiales bacterium]
MITEHVVLDVVPGQEEEFEEAFTLTKGLIAASPGFRSLRLSRCLEVPNLYLLLVEWDTLEDHLEGFQQSAAFAEWREAMTRFYRPGPVLQHFGQVDAA